MEVLFISHKYPPSIGGMEKQSFELVSFFEKTHKVHKLVYDGSGSRIGFFLTLKSRVKKYLKENPKIELIHLNDGLMVAACHWIKQICSIPVVATIHGLDVVFPLAYFQRKLPIWLAALDAIITVSSATAYECITRGVDARKISVVHNGVDHDMMDYHCLPDELNAFQDRFNLDFKKHTIVVSIGRAVKRKGFSWFVKEVVPKLEEEIRYLIIGPKTSRSEWKFKLLQLLPRNWRTLLEMGLGLPSDGPVLEELLSDENYNHKVTHLGKLSFADLKLVLHQADIFAMPNLKVEGDMEGFGLVNLEAALSGCLVLASAVDGITDAVHDGENGILIEEQNAEQWIKIINRYHKEPRRFFALQEKAPIYTKTYFSWEEMGAHYEKTFNRVRNKNHISALSYV